MLRDHNFGGIYGRVEPLSKYAKARTEELKLVNLRRMGIDEKDEVDNMKRIKWLVAPGA